MDFFSHQDVARAQTRKLIVFFALSVIALIAIISLSLTTAILTLSDSKFTSHSLKNQYRGLEIFSDQGIGILIITAAITLIVIAIGSFYKIYRLKSGGSVVATSLGGRLLSPNTQVAEERKLLNVVEEMAIAAGVPVPSVYLLDDEEGINAFAAGFTLGDAVIGVTKGTVDKLSRDELQGVIAHEFSHIINGDMRLNIRAIGILHGIIVVAICGELLFRLSANTRGSSRRSSNNDSRLVAVFLLTGVILIILGRIGVLGARMIKSAISRQREFLADASAVQFTRNPDGIGGALKEIYQAQKGSKIESPRAEESSHLFFSNALSASWMQLLSTHPPLLERIKRVSAHLIDETMKDSPVAGGADHDSLVSNLQGVTSSSVENSQVVQAAEATKAQNTQAMLASFGTLVASHVDQAKKTISELPPELINAAREPYGARALIYLLILSDDQRLREEQKKILMQSATPDDAQMVQKLEQYLPKDSSRIRLPLVDLSLPALRQLSDWQNKDFSGMARKLVQHDSQVNFFEYVLLRIVFKSTEPRAVSKNSSRRTPALNHIDAGIVLSMIAWIGHADIKDAAPAFKAGIDACPPLQGSSIILIDQSVLSLTELDRALTSLDTLTPAIKRDIIQACIAIVVHDRTITSSEYELLRAVGSVLDCPLPIAA